jgi:serine/threonine-protein kinase
VLIVKEYLEKHDSRLQFGNYRLLRLIKRGAFVTIYEGEHVHLEHKVTIKVLNSWKVSESALKRFWTEARIHTSLRHPNIVRALDFGLQGRVPFLVMDYADQGTLQEYFVPGKPLAVTTIVPFVQSIAHALYYVHCHNVIHRDIKPQNILLGAADEVWLSDFGIAIAAQPWSKQSVQEAVGTALYAAPEQIMGHPVAASDQYALAVLVYDWLCGRPPFEGSSTQLCQQHLYYEIPRLRQYVPAIPQAVEKVVLKALSKDPYQRFTTVQEFAHMLQEAAFDHHTAAHCQLQWLHA